MERLKVAFSDDEYCALCELAERESRPIDDEIRAIVRERLRRVKLLDANYRLPAAARCNN